MKCSVCMATYNGEKYIEQQVLSIIQQLGAEDELIISDDSSTDDTLRILEAFNDDRIKVFTNVRKKGPVGNFENALNHAQYDFIFLADQDDLWLPGKVKKHMELMQQYELVTSDAVVVKEDGTVLFDSFFKARNAGKGFFKNLWKSSYLGCCMSFRRSLLDRALPFPENLYMHDWWLALIAELEDNVCFCDSTFLRYVRHADNVTQTLETRLPWSKRLANRLNFMKFILYLKMKRKL